MKEKEVNIDTQTEDFFYDNIKISEIPGQIQQIINSKQVFSSKFRSNNF